MKKSRDKQIAILLAATLLAVYFYGQIDHSDPQFKDWDSHYYLKIADAFPNIDDSAIRPFSFRLAGPFIAGALPLDPAVSFMLLTVAGLIVTVIGFYLFLVYLGVESNLALFASLLYILNKHFFGFVSWNYFHVNDIIMNIVLLSCFWAIYERRWLLFAVALLIGSATRETFIIMIPTGLVYLLFDSKNRSDIWRLLVSSAPAILLFLLIRMLITPENGRMLIASLSDNYTKLFRVGGIYHQLINPFVPLTMIPVIYFKETYRFFRGRLHMLAYLLLIFIASLFGENNERLIHPGFIVFFYLLASIIGARIESRLMRAVILAAAVLGSLHYLIARFPLPSRDFTIITSGGGAVLLTLILLWYKYRIGKGRAESA